jgi:hypothetical protein
MLSGSPKGYQRTGLVPRIFVNIYKFVLTGLLGTTFLLDVFGLTSGSSGVYLHQIK